MQDIAESQCGDLQHLRKTGSSETHTATEFTNTHECTKHLWSRLALSFPRWFLAAKARGGMCLLKSFSFFAEWMCCLFRETRFVPETQL